MEIEAVAGESRDGFRKFRGVRVLVGRGGRARGLWLRWWLVLLLLMAEGGERGFNPEASLALAPLGGCFFGGGEGEEAEGQ